MAIKFNTDEFKRNMNKRTLDLFPENDNQIVKKELKKRYNFSIRPSNNKILMIEAKKRNISKSELLDKLIERNFKKE